MTFGNRSTTSGRQKGGGERGSGGGRGRIKKTCLSTRRTDAGGQTRASELMKLQLLPRRESEPRNGGERGRDAHKDVLRYITVNKQLDGQTEGGTDLQKGREGGGEDRLVLCQSNRYSFYQVGWRFQYKSADCTSLRFLEIGSKQ